MGRLGQSAVGRLGQLDEGRSDTVIRDRRLRYRRELADASVQSMGLGECRKQVDAASAGVFIILTSRSFLLGESGS